MQFTEIDGVRFYRTEKDWGAEPKDTSAIDLFVILALAAILVGLVYVGLQIPFIQ
jgi:hypothetical protein